MVYENCGSTLQIFTIWFINGTPQLHSRSGFINPGLTLWYIYLHNWVMFRVNVGKYGWFTDVTWLPSGKLT